MSSALELRNVSKSFGAAPIFDQISFTVGHGEIAAIVGPSGQGKTTILRLIAGFDSPSTGEILMDGVCVSDTELRVNPEKRGIGYVPQDGALFPHLTVAENVAFGLRRGAKQRVEEMLRLVGLHGLGDRRPDEISGGQMQRVALARALAPEPRMVLMDEPFSALDAAMRIEVRDEVHAILRKTGTTTVMVTHDQAEAMSIADHVIVMLDGGIAQTGSPRNIYDNPASVQVAAFVGEANFVHGVASNGEISNVFGRSRYAGANGNVIVMFRPEHLRLVSDGVRGRVETTTYYGHDAAVGVRFENGERVTVRIDTSAMPAVGETVSVECIGSPVVFAEEADGSASRLGGRG